MEVTALTLMFSSAIFTFLTNPVLSSNPCKSDSCNAIFGPKVRFPFRLKDRQPGRCGFPGFDLYCNSQNQTILNLPESGEFVVDHIDYTAQAIFINDPAGCLPKRSLNFSLAGSSFHGAYTRNFTILNCSSDFREYSPSRYMPLFCLSGRNYTVLAMDSDSHSQGAQVPATCRKVTSVLVPLAWAIPEFYWTSMDLKEDLQLVWSEPSCWSCENQDGVCGFKGDSGQEIACYTSSSKSGLSSGAKYGIIIGIGVPGLVCIIGLICYALGMVRASGLRRHLNSSLPTTALDQWPAIRSVSGLDQPTIESYPTTVLGESRRLPKPSDVTCPICLSDYEPKETLRSIPECNHYFHAECIDEWLKSNGSCPLCRNSPKSSVGTPCSSTSMSPSSSSSSSSSSTTSDRH